MLRPDSVSLVSPPIATAPNAIPAMPASHHPTIFGTGFSSTTTVAVLRR